MFDMLRNNHCSIVRKLRLPGIKCLDCQYHSFSLWFNPESIDQSPRSVIGQHDSNFSFNGFHFYYEKGIYVWDVAAAGLIVQQAGGIYEQTSTDVDGRFKCFAAANQSLSENFMDRFTDL